MKNQQSNNRPLLKPLPKGEKDYLRNNSNLSIHQEGKIPPQAQEIEETVLGIIMFEGSKMFETVSDILQKEDVFYNPRCSELWKTMQKLVSDGLPVDLLTVSNEYLSRPEKDQIWGAYELSGLTMKIVSSANIESYCRILQEKYMARRLIETCNTSIRAAYNDDIFEVLQFTEDSVFELTLGKTSSDYRSIASISDENLHRIIDQVNNHKAITGIPSGLDSLDRVTGGWQKSDSIIIAARPGLGKTAFALNLAYNALKQQFPVGFFSLEMSQGQLFNRLLSIDSLVPLEAIRRADLTKDQLDRVAASASFLKRLPFYIDDEAAISLYNLKAKARRMKTKHKIELLIIDYLQLIHGDGHGKVIREQEISSISKGIKALAKSLDIPIIALSQLSRAVDNRSGENKKPQLSDLRESGSIEQDANMVIFISRPDYQKVEGEYDPALANTAELNIAKHRDGRLANLTIDTDLSTQRFMEPNYGSFENPNKSFRDHPFFDDDKPF